LAQVWLKQLRLGAVGKLRSLRPFRVETMGCGSSKQEKAKGGGGTNSSSASHQGEKKDNGKKENEKLLDNYTLGKVLGQGAFGVVYSCKQKGGSKEFAVKMIDQVETPLEEIKQECKMLMRFEHRSVVKLHAVYYEKVFVCMVLEIYKGGDMIEGMQLHWKSKGMIPIPVIQNLSKQMFESVAYLHQSNVVHRDLKGDNYLQDRKALEDPNCRVFLSDFGTVVDLEPGKRLNQKCGTKTYWSPEFYKQNYGLKVDVWALGVVIFGMVTGRFPFKGQPDVESKPVKVPSRCGEDGETFIKGTLTRDEAERLTAAGALKHTFMASIKSAAQVADEKDDKLNFKPEVQEARPGAGIQERRRELVDRLEKQANKAKADSKDEEFNSPQQLFDSFTVHDKHHSKTSTFQWWAPDKCSSVLDLSNAKNYQDDSSSNARASQDGIRHMLVDHKIDPSQFGTNSAKTLMEFVEEVQRGQSRLMLDATKHKNVVRVVDVVLLRIAYGTKPNRKYLIKTSEKYPDGRVREDINQLPGTKKMPHENGIQTAKRILQERLNFADAQIVFDPLKKECFEDDEESPSYPGVRTVYRKEIYEGVVTTTDPAILDRLGLRAGKYERQDTKSYTRFFSWMTEADCKSNKVKLTAPAAGSEISALVAPPIGYEEEELAAFLAKNNVDMASFGKDGAKSLTEFSEELVKGEAALTRNQEGNIVRVVDVLILKLTRNDGKIVVEVSETHEVDGQKKTKDVGRMPAVKRRADENMFLAAHRVLSRVLKISENMVEIDANKVLVTETTEDSAGYPGLPTLYRRRIVHAKLLH